MEPSGGSAVPPDPGSAGRLTRDQALALLQRGSDLLGSGDYAEAGQHFSRVVGFDDPTITAAALLGLGEAHYRLNAEDAALASWQAVLQLPETPSTYTAWRNVAAARVRDGDLTGAIAAYREADKRAPAQDKAEIANRLGWLTKETGDTRSASRYFAKGRGDSPRVTVTLVLIALTTIVSLTAMFATEGPQIYDWLQLDKLAVAAGEYWRLWTVTLLHSPTDPLHLAFNMYALWLSGTIVERWYGPWRFLAFYLVCAAAGSTGSFVFGFASGGSIDNAAHLGGLAAGLWLGAIVPPTGVPTMSSLWHKPGESRAAVGRATAPGYVFALGIAVVGVVVAAGIAVGTSQRVGSLPFESPPGIADSHVVTTAEPASGRPLGA